MSSMISIDESEDIEITYSDLQFSISVNLLRNNDNQVILSLTEYDSEGSLLYKKIIYDEFDTEYCFLNYDDVKKNFPKIKNYNNECKKIIKDILNHLIPYRNNFTNKDLELITINLLSRTGIHHVI